jgi:uncharacterized membrane protein
MLCLVLAYPLLTHAAIWLDEPRLQWLALTVLAATAIYDALKHKRLWAWLLLPALSVMLYGLVRLGGGVYALFLPPVLLPAALLTLFARSLRSGSVPLITRFATAVRGSLPEDLARYTDSVTFWWSIAFAMLTASAIGFAVFASRELWSVMTNFVHYVLLGVLFLGEYLYRLKKFRHLEHPGFIAYLRLLFATRVRAL